MNKKYLSYLLLMMLVTVTACHLTIPEDQFLIRKRVSVGDTLMLFTTIDEMVGPDFQPERTYYAYRFGKINTMQGTASGKPLHGDYDVFYQKSPIEKGTFRSGLKHGLWYRWDEKGILMETVSYKKGLRDGEFIRYDPVGKPVLTGKYKDDLLHGWITVSEDSKVYSLKYKKGMVTDTLDASGFKWPPIKKSSKKKEE